MQRIRILLAGLPRMLADIVQGVMANQPDLEVVPFHGADLSDAIDRSGADVVLVDLVAGESPRIYDALLYAHPRLKLFALGGEGGRVLLYDLQPRAELLGNVSPDQLIEAVRSAAQARGV